MWWFWFWFFLGFWGGFFSYFSSTVPVNEQNIFGGREGN